MNVPYNREFKIERLTIDEVTEKYNPSPEAIYSEAITQLASIKATAFRRESAEKTVRVARGSLLPQINLYSNVFSNYSSAATASKLISSQDVATNDYVELSGEKLPVKTSQRVFENSKIGYNSQLRNNYSSSLSIGLRIPIFNSLTTRNRVSLAKIELNQAEAAENTTKLQLKQAVDLAWFNWHAANERLEILKNQVAAFSDSFHAAEVRFNAGVGTVVDYTIAKNNLDKANINLINARYDYLLRIKILDYYQGRLSI